MAFSFKCLSGFHCYHRIGRELRPVLCRSGLPVYTHDEIKEVWLTDKCCDCSKVITYQEDYER